MNVNHVLCKNRVEVEGVDIGNFETFKMQASSRTLGNTAVLEIPLYAIGEDGFSGRASKRYRAGLEGIKVCSEVKVYLWYEWYDFSSASFVAEPEILKFSGWIEHIGQGFPSKIYLQDNAFILRFGSIEEAWDEDATVQKIMEDCIPIAQEAFDKERKSLGFTREVPRLTYSIEKKNVQAVTTSLSFRNWGGRSPHDTLQKLMQLMVMYGGVGDDFNVFIGVGVTESDRPLVALSTATNVIEREIIPVDGRFVDYDVKVFGILKNGRQYTATGGYMTSKSASQKSAFEKAALGETIRGHSTANTVDGIQEHADRMLKMLRENRNSGTMKLLLYPNLEIMDWVTYDDTIFEELSGSYYVLDYSFEASVNGYFQTIRATDKVFVL